MAPTTILVMPVCMARFYGVHITSALQGSFSPPPLPQAFPVRLLSSADHVQPPEADYESALPPAGNAPAPVPGRSSVAFLMLGSRVDASVMVVVPKVPRFAGSDPVAAAGTAHQSSIHEARQALAHLLVLVAITPESGAKWLHFGSCCRVWPE